MIDMLMLISDILAKCNRLIKLYNDETAIDKRAEYSLRLSLLFDVLSPYGQTRLQETSNVYILDIAEVSLEREHEQITITGTVGADGYDIHMTREQK